MGCDITKLEYLEETKQIFREKIDPKGKKIKDNTPFRDYADYMGRGNEPKRASLAAFGMTGKIGKATKNNEYVTE